MQVLRQLFKCRIAQFGYLWASKIMEKSLSADEEDNYLNLFFMSR